MEAGAAPDPGVPEGPGGVCRPRAQGTFPLQRRGSTERPGDKPPVSGGSRPVCVPGCQTDAAETCWKQNPVSCSSCCLCWGQEEGHSHVARSTPACGRLTPPDPRLRPQQDVQAGTTWGARCPDRPPWNAPVPCLSGQHLLSAQPACTRHILSRQPWGLPKHSVKEPHPIGSTAPALTTAAESPGRLLRVWTVGHTRTAQGPLSTSSPAL